MLSEVAQKNKDERTTAIPLTPEIIHAQNQRPVSVLYLGPKPN